MLSGETLLTLCLMCRAQGQAYRDPGAAAYDAVDGAITAITASGGAAINTMLVTHSCCRIVCIPTQARHHLRALLAAVSPSTSPEGLSLLGCACYSSHFFPFCVLLKLG